MCCYQQWILLVGVDGRQEEQKEEEEEAVWFHRGRHSLIYPRKALRNWRRTRRAKLSQQRKANYRVILFLLKSHTEKHSKQYLACIMHLKWKLTMNINCL